MILKFGGLIKIYFIKKEDTLIVAAFVSCENSFSIFFAFISEYDNKMYKKFAISSTFCDNVSKIIF